MAKIPKQLAGFKAWGDGEPFEDKSGPFFMRLNDPNQGNLSAMITDSSHMNSGGFLHGGLLMTFADYALFVIAYDELDGAHAVTVSCQAEFLASTDEIGTILHATGTVTRNTRSLIFVRGQITKASDPNKILTTFSGIIKRVGNK